jgi:arylsulfatase A-like enzyme
MRLYHLTFTAMSFLASLLPVAAPAKSLPPNILFILSDDHALEAIGAYGSWLKDYVQTPTIDRLAAEGMRFTKVCCNNSICSPSRASIITGQYSHTNGGINLNCSLKEEAPSYNRQLQQNGYQTAVIGKWHMKHMPRGMDFFAVTKGQGKYVDPTFSWKDKTTTDHTGYYADVYADVALDWLKHRDRNKPFCLNLHFKGPHHPYDYPKRHENLLADTLLPEPPSLHEDVAVTSPLLKGKHWGHLLRNRGYYHRHVDDTYPEMWPHDNSDRSKISAAYQHMIHKYIRAVAAIDENIKRVIDYLEAEGLKDDTVIVYSSDQGYWLGQHGLYDKRLILEESLKMPLIVRYPRMVKAGSVNHDLVSNVDYAPTLLELAGITVDPRMQGRSIVPLLKGQTPGDWREAIWYAYWAAGHPHFGMRSERFKLILFPGSNAFEFYDLKKDPQEMTNQSGNPEYAQVIEAARQTLESLKKEVNITAGQMPGKGASARNKAPTLEKDRKRKKKNADK